MYIKKIILYFFFLCIQYKHTCSSSSAINKTCNSSKSSGEGSGPLLVPFPRNNTLAPVSDSKYFCVVPWRKREKKYIIKIQIEKIMHIC